MTQEAVNTTAFSGAGGDGAVAVIILLSECDITIYGIHAHKFRFQPLFAK